MITMNRLSFAISRSNYISQCWRHLHNTASVLPSIGILRTPVSSRNYVISCTKSYPVCNIVMGNQFSSDATQIKIPIVSYDEVKDLPNHPEKVLIDVREPDELKETGIIPTAINIPCEVNTALSLNDKQFKTKYNRDKPDYADEIIFHCKIGKRSENAAITATKLGYTNAKNYQGSWLDWAEREGLPK